MIEQAVTKEVSTQFIQWTGGNLSAIRDFAGDEYLSIDANGTVIILFRTERFIQPLYLGWYLLKYDGDDFVRVMTPRVFADTFEVTEAANAG